MFHSIKAYYRSHPLRFILILAFLFRLLAAIFSRGYAFTDDHFFVIEEAEQWMMGNGTVQDWWRPFITGEERISHSTLYTFLHYLFFQILHVFGINNPEIKMLFVRLIHAAYSLLILYFGYRITSILSNKKAAINVAWMLGFLWFAPFLSVRNLVEWVCIPPLLYATFLALKSEHRTQFFLVGLLAALAFVIRYQTVLITASIGLIIWYQKGFRSAYPILLGFLFGGFIYSGVLDYFLFGVPFHELIGYVEYNMTHAGEYPNGPWYQYILIVVGMLGLGLPILWIKRIAQDYKRWLILLIPTLAFFLFHSYFPNKQERFILPMIPFVIILGNITARQDGWNKRLNQLFWVLNIPLLLLLTVSSTKTVKMDAMLFLRDREVEHFAIESSNERQMEFIPQFYWGKWSGYQHFMPGCQARCFFDSVRTKARPMPEYILFFQDRALDERLDSLKIFVNLALDTTIESSWLDRLIPKLNPVVKSPTIKIYRVEGWNEKQLPASSSTSAIEATTSTKTTESSRATPTEVTSTSETSSKKDGWRIES
jgi:hypothetical protein